MRDASAKTRERCRQLARYHVERADRDPPPVWVVLPAVNRRVSCDRVCVLTHRRRPGHTYHRRTIPKNLVVGWIPFFFLLFHKLTNLPQTHRTRPTHARTHARTPWCSCGVPLPGQAAADACRHSASETGCREGARRGGKANHRIHDYRFLFG